MSTCELAKQGVSAGGYVRVSFDNGVIQEAVAKDRTTKPRIREIPKAYYGDKPLTHLGSMILERMAAGYQVLKEDQELSIDRITSAFMASSSKLVDVALNELLPLEMFRSLNSGETITSRGMLVAKSVFGDQVSLRVTFLSSALDRDSATFLAVLNRLSRECTSADHVGSTCNLSMLIKVLTHYESLGDNTLDRLQKLGLSLRPVDFRQLKPAMTGFVGV